MILGLIAPLIARNEEQLYKMKVKDFMKTVGCSESTAKVVMHRRKMSLSLFEGESNWRKFYE